MVAAMESNARGAAGRPARRPARCTNRLLKKAADKPLVFVVVG
jgi:hypothetical protein